MRIEKQILYGANITGFEGRVVCIDCATEGLGMNTKNTYILFEVNSYGKVINPFLKVVIRDRGAEGVDENGYHIEPNKISSVRDVGVGSLARVSIKATSEKGVTFNGEKPPLYTEEMKRKLFW